MPTVTKAESPKRKRRGPKPKGYERTCVMLTPELIDWAMSQPEGLSGTLRLVLSQERARRETAAATGD